MIALPRERRSRELLLAFAAGALVLSASLANFLTHNDYPLVRADVAIVLAAVLLLAAALAPFYVAQRQWGRSLLDGLLIGLFADLNGVSLSAALAVGAAAGLFAFWLKKPLSGPIALFGAVVLVTTIASAGTRQQWLHTERHDLPASASTETPPFAVLHLILDEQIGIQGVQPDATGLRLRQELRDFFLAREFALYGRAYSEHMHTVNALPAVLNYGADSDAKASMRGVTVGKTAYFTQLRRRGFRVNVLQNDFAELCADNPVALCTTYDSSSLRPTLTAPLSTTERAQLMSLKFIALSKLGAQFISLLNRAAAIGRRLGADWPAFEPANLARTSTVAALAALEQWSPHLHQAGPGDVYFAHVLLPHFPHVVRADCSYLPWRKWELRRSDTGLEQRRLSYAAQNRCTLRKLDGIIRAFEASTGGRNGAIIIHGDHGSRIMRTPPVSNHRGRFTDDDVIAAHSTLFAVRATRPQPRYFQRPQPINSLLRDFTANEFQTAPEAKASNARGYVISDANWRPQGRTPLPPGW